MNAHDSWLERPYAERDAADAAFSERLDERVEAMMAELANGSDADDCEHVYDDPHDLLRRIVVALLNPGTPGAERAMEAEDVLRDKCVRIATYLLEREQ